MVSNAHVARKILARRGGVWYPWVKDDPHRLTEGFTGCSRCQRYTPRVVSLCNWNNCTEVWCGTCGRYTVGMGPAGCGCDWDGNASGARGHHTKAEQPRPKTGKHKKKC